MLIKEPRRTYQRGKAGIYAQSNWKIIHHPRESREMSNSTSNARAGYLGGIPTKHGIHTSHRNPPLSLVPETFEAGRFQKPPPEAIVILSYFQQRGSRGLQHLCVSTLIYYEPSVLPAVSSPMPTLQRGRVSWDVVPTRYFEIDQMHQSFVHEPWKIL